MRSANAGPVAAVLCLVILLGSIAPSPLAAQDSHQRAEQFTVSLLPQYDTRSLFLIYEATLAVSGEDVAFGIPYGVRLEGAYYRNEEGGWQVTDAHFEALPEGRVIRFQAHSDEVRLEMYWNVIPKEPQRYVNFSLPPQQFDIEALRWVAAFPSDATAIVTEPSMTFQGTSHGGLQTYTREAAPLPAGEETAQTIEWIRESDEPAFDGAEPEKPATGPGEDSWSPLYVAAGLLFLLGLILFVTGVLRLRRLPDSPRSST